MKYRPLLVLTFLSFTAQLHALTDKAREAIKQFESAVEAEVKAEPKTPDGLSSRSNKTAMLAQLRLLLSRTENPQFLESLSQYSSYFTSENVQKSLATLQEEIRAERDATDKAQLANIAELLAKAGKLVKEAKTPAELDDTITELGKYRQRGERGQISEEVRAAYYQVEPTLQFVINWQNYLSGKAQGNLEASNGALQGILNNSNSPYLIPRSQILTLLKTGQSGDDPSLSNQKDTAEKILADIKSLADIETALIRLRDLQKSRRNYNGNDSISNITQNLQQIDKTYQDFKAGLAVNIELYQNFNSNGVEVGNALFSRLKSDLLFLVLPRYVGAPDGTTPKTGEDTIHFLDRVATEAKERGDISVSLRSREALRLLQRGGSFNNNDTVGMAAYVSGQNQETANQYLLAVISYQTALKSGSDLVPAKIIGERLAAIQTAHPKEFDLAMERFLNPPVQRYEGMRPMDGRQTQERSQPALLIPPAPVSSPTPTPAPSATPSVTPVSSPSPAS